MSTLIELYDNETICNSIAVLSLHFDRVVFLCDNHDKGGKIVALAAYVSRRTPNIQVDIQYTDTLNYEGLCYLLDQFNGQDPYFEMTGGQGALLIAVTRYCLQHNSRCFFINLPEKKFVEINRATDLANKFTFPHYSIQEALMSAGAIFDGNNHPPIDVNNSQLVNQALLMWQIVRADLDSWIHLSSILSHAHANNNTGYSNSLSLQLDNGQYEKLSQRDGNLLNKLSSAKLITIFQNNGETNLRFANDFVLSQFKTTGNILEYATFLTLYRSKLFTDVKMSVIIDYDYKDTSSSPSCCEIDVIAIKDVTPLFISCKIGQVHENDLYEIKLNTMKIVGTIGIACLITGYDMRRINPVLYRKANELGITVIDRQVLLSDQLTTAVCKLLNVLPAE